METKTSNPFERAFSGFAKPWVLSAIAGMTGRKLKNSIIQELTEQASEQIKEIDKTRDFLVQGVYVSFREQVRALTEGRADGLETPSAALPPGITHEGSTSIMSYPHKPPLRPLGYFSPRPDSKDAELFWDLNKQIFPNSLTTHDLATLIILCVKEATSCDLVSVELHWTDEASCWAWDFVGQLSPEAKLRLALDLLNQKVYSGR